MKHPDWASTAPTLSFQEGLPYQKLKLLETKPLHTGGVILTYAVA